MSLTSGIRFNSYLISESIGVGGMGEVYRATDTSLKRDVAIKVLPESFATDAERLARFQREAELLASLNHTNIAQIYGIEKSAGITALVMELIEGPTLADRIAQGPLPTDEALNIAMQICSALEAAHAKGIIHRDLKPANIKLRPDGTVKVLDFGIAKAIDNQAGNSGAHAPALTTPAMTMSGVILGTAAYMSPEQARGKAVDERADIWAFGCVLYEMLTGQPVFGGEDVTITLARVLEREIDMNTIPATLPPAVRHTIRLCLRKDPKKRIRDISDVRLALQGEFETLPATVAHQTVARTGLHSLLGRILTHAGALSAGALLAGLALWLVLQPQPEPVNRFGYSMPADQFFRNMGRNVLAVSPDGRHFAYNTAQGMYLRDMGALQARLIAGTEPTLINPFFSRDGQSLAFYSADDQKLKRISINGGAPVSITDVGNNLYGASWAADDTILFGQPVGIFRVPAAGGTAELIIPNQQPGELLGSPELLPDGDTVMFSATTGSFQTASIIAQSLRTGTRTVLVEGGTDAHYLPSGHLVYTLSDTIFGIAFDPATLEVSGAAVPLVENVMRADITASSNYGVAANGTLVYVSGSVVSQLRTLVWVRRDGVEEAIPIEPSIYNYPRLSPLGDQIALDDRNVANDIWVWDIAAETRRRLTLGGTGGQYPAWTADGRRITFTTPTTIDWRMANNTGQTETLQALATTQAGAFLGGSPWFFTPSGEQLVFRGSNAGTGEDIGMFTIGSTAEPVWLLHEPYTERNAELSPDGRFMAYESNESGTNEIYVRPFPNVDDDQTQVSNAGGTKPVWSRDGRELFYMQEVTGLLTKLWSVALDPAAATFTFGTRTAILEWPWFVANSGRTYDVSPDGQRFLAIKDIDSDFKDNGVPQFVIVENWQEELERLVPKE